MYTLGYDVGSSSIKASLLDVETNTIIASAQFPDQEMPIFAKQPGWAEQEPDMWWEAIIETTNRLKETKGIDLKDVKAIGISYQMHGLVVVNKNHKTLRPSIIWCDSRSVKYGNRAFEELGEDFCRQRLLNSPGNFTAAKLAWVKENEQALFDQVYKIMLPGDYIALKLSGSTTTTHSGLSEGIFFDFLEDSVSKELLQHFGFRQELIPAIVPTFGEQCFVSKSASSLLGLQAGTPITYRAGDQSNNALSLNVFEPGEIAATAGTSGVVYGVTDQVKSDPHFRVNGFAHVNHSEIKRRIGILLCINGTGILNAWTKRNLAFTSYQEMNDYAKEVPIGSEGLTILPFGNGAERILQNKNIGCQIHGMQFNTHHKGHISRGVQEGIAASFRYGTDILKEIGIQPNVVRAGQANLFLSEVFQKAVANLTCAQIELYETDGAAGAARGAGIGLGVYNEQSAFAGLKMLKLIEPSESQINEYDDMYQRWKAHLETAMK